VENKELPKIKKRAKPLSSIDKRKTKGRVSNKDLEELDDQQEMFAMYLGMGETPELAGTRLGLSRYKIGTWPSIPLLKQKVEQYKQVFAKAMSEEDLAELQNKMKAVREQLFNEAVADLLRRLRDGKASEGLVLKMVSMGFVNADMDFLPTTDEEVTKITETHQKKIEHKGGAKERVPKVPPPPAFSNRKEDDEVIDAKPVEEGKDDGRALQEGKQEG